MSEMMIEVMIKTLKGTVLDFLTCCKLSQTQTPIWTVCKTCAISGTYYVEQIVCHMVQRNSSAVKSD